LLLGEELSRGSPPSGHRDLSAFLLFLLLSMASMRPPGTGIPLTAFSPVDVGGADRIRYRAAIDVAASHPAIDGSARGPPAPRRPCGPSPFVQPSRTSPVPRIDMCEQGCAARDLHVYLQIALRITRR
jgi:hypothetical protein